MDVVEGLNKVAVGLGEQARTILEDEVVGLDVEVSKNQHEMDELKKQMEKVHKLGAELWRERKHKSESLDRLSDDIRELKRPRDGYLHLDDIMYESRMNGIRATVHGLHTELTRVKD